LQQRIHAKIYHNHIVSSEGEASLLHNHIAISVYPLLYFTLKQNLPTSILEDQTWIVRYAEDQWS